ncbi:two-component system alkaline phosphatase synthesis response regulator PhoP/two-component system response regulator MtrA [Geodermatophilus tzadiensis]|uniref:Two-component system alkaline phosphatase synthesis response regulator PhoP/two-component system response regulator MtrA n=1 Tax=Geodermatophilus tzadiensis TaxID=1137988 RepID=A0A2T0TQI4_9ACTN|nr:response regulator transcription factor [Geodermatophilus tzadiensis]PRY47926.1 two-component system alkaline phosphatase synthesis response regulator PhoP/two-component system response regulator MtrA [Geodermatophilus tzadiensis]
MGPLVRPVVVLVEDERDLAVMAEEFLRREGFDVVLAGDGRTGMQRLDDRAVDAVVLDLGLPDGNGLDLLRSLRRSGRAVPVVVLTGRGRESDQVLGLELGADDYVVKPFSLPELAARLRAVLRRSSDARPTASVEVGDLVIDTAAHEATVKGELLPLRPLEHDLLAFLAASPRQVFSPEQLLERVWGGGADRQSASTVAEHVYRLRQKLQRAEVTTPRIVTVRGVGYRLDP